LKRLELGGEVEPQEAVAAQDQESILCHEFPEERQLHATIATRRAILPENAVNLPKVEEIDHLLKVLMVGASSVMRRVIKRLIAQTEEEIGTEVEVDLALTQEAFRKEDRDLDLTPEVRKSKFTIAHHVGVHPNDNQISFYAVTPSGFQSEIGAESKYVPENYEPIMFRGFSVWGHSMSYKVRLMTFLSNSKLFIRKFFGLKDLPEPKCFNNLNNGINS